MSNINIIAVPNGFFTLDDALEAPPIQQAIIQIRQEHRLDQEGKLKSLLSFYQTVDTLAQLKAQNFEDVEFSHVAQASVFAVNAAFEKIMASFGEQGQARLYALFQPNFQH